MSDVFGLFYFMRDRLVFEGVGVSRGLSVLQNDRHLQKANKEGKRSHVA